MIHLVNNGSHLAEEMHKEELIQNGMTLDQLAEVAKSHTCASKHHFLERDYFWEDFAYRADELGHKLKY